MITIYGCSTSSPAQPTRGRRRTNNGESCGVAMVYGHPVTDNSVTAMFSHRASNTSRF